MTPEDFEPLAPDPSALRTVDDHMRSAAEGLRRAAGVAAPPLEGRSLSWSGRLATTDQPAPGFSPRRLRKRLVILALAVAALVATFVLVTTGSGPSDQHHNVPAAPVAPATTEAPPTTGVQTTFAPSPAGAVTITPSTGLTDQQVVHVVGKGFLPGVTYTATECANKGAALDPSIDCAVYGAPGTGSAASRISPC